MGRHRAGRHRAAPDRSPWLAAAVVVVALGGTWTVTRPAADTSTTAPAPVREHVALPRPPDPPPSTPVPEPEPAPEPEPEPESEPSTEPEPDPDPEPEPEPEVETVTALDDIDPQLLAVDCPDTGFDGVAPHVARAGHHLQQLFNVAEVLGVGSRPGASDHETGHALDFMVDPVTGDALVAYVIEHADELGIKYVIWWRRIWQDGSWEPYSGASPHLDHPHLSFNRTPGSGLPC